MLPEVVVRVLGPVDVHGAARPFTRAWSLDLVVYLAMHPRGATSEGWATALWPDRLPAEATRHSTVSAARRTLGRAAAGHDHLPRSGRGRLGLAPSVTSDWAQFRALAALEGPAAPDGWTAALDLVRGRPFDGLRSPDWVVLDGVEAEVQDAIVHLATRVAEHLLASGDGRGAERGLRKALLASPYDERLYRLLLVAADRQGNPAAVEATMAELLRLMGAGDVSDARKPGGAAPSQPDEVLALVHPQTVAVYRSLCRGSGHLRRALGPGDRGAWTAGRRRAR